MSTLVHVIIVHPVKIQRSGGPLSLIDKMSTRKMIASRQSKHTNKITK